MTSFERNILKKIENKLWVFILIVAFAAGCYVRISLRNYISPDMWNYLYPWYDEIKNNGGLSALRQQVGNYNVLYQFIIALFTYLPIVRAFAYKMLSIAFDLLLAATVGLHVYDRSDEQSVLKAVIGFSAVWLSPIVIMNSSMWGQCDSIYTFFVVMSLFSLEKERFNKAFILLGVALAFKLQAIFILPFFVYRYLSEKKFSLIRFLILPLVIWISSIPAIIFGRGLFTGFEIYFSQANEYPALSMNAPGFANFMAINGQVLHYEYMAPLLICAAAAVCIGLIFYILINRFKLNGSNYYLFALILTYSCVFFLPSMHERYGFIYEILAILYCLYDKRTIVPCILLQLISLCTYGNCLLEGTVPLKWLSILNVLVYCTYLFFFFKDKKEVMGGEEE